MDAINQRFKLLRKSCSMNQGEFGLVLGISPSGVSEIEMGRRNVTEKHLIMLSNWSEFRVNIDWMRTGEGEMFLSPPDTTIESIADEYGLSRRETVLVERFLNLPSETRQAILDYVLDVAAIINSEEQQKTAPATPPGLEDAEAAYEKRFGFASSRESSASTTTNGTVSEDAVNN